MEVQRETSLGKTGVLRKEGVLATVGWLPFLVFFAITTLTIICSYYTYELSKAKDTQRFATVTQRLVDSIHSRMEMYVSLLRGVAGSITSESSSELSVFHRIAQNVELERHYPGVQGIGFAKRILPNEVEDLRKTLHKGGREDFTIFPPGEREEYFPIIFLYPYDKRNAAAIGYDMFSEPIRRKAMEQARNFGLPVASGKVTLVQEIDEKKQAGFLLYVPVYSEHIPSSSQEKRNEKLIGFVYSPFRADDLFQGIFGSETDPRLNFWVYDGLKQEEEYLLYHSDKIYPSSPNYTSRFQSVVSLDIAGRIWTIKVTSRAPFETTADENLYLWVLGAGMFMATVLSGAAWSRTRSTRVVEEQREWLRVTLASIGDAVIATDRDGNITFVNPLASVLTGWNENEAKGTLIAKVFNIEHEVTGEPFDTPVSRVIQSGETVTLGHHSVLVNCFGEKIPIEHSAAPIKAPHGSILGMVVVFHDVTQKRKLEVSREVEQSVVKLIANADNLQKVGSEIIEVVCTKLNWELGRLWLTNAEFRSFSCIAVWPSNTSPGQAPLSVNSGLSFPNLVNEEAHAFPWGPWEIKQEDNIGIAFPLHVDGRPVGILEFFSKVSRFEDKALLASMHSICLQIGQLLERRKEGLIRKATLETALDGIITIDHQGLIREFNPSAERTFGYFRNEVLGKDFSELLIPVHLRTANRQSIAEYLSSTSELGETGRRFETVVCRKNGEVFPCEITVSQISLFGPPLYTSFVRDLSERKKAEEMLQIHGRVLESMTEGVSLSDENGIIVYTNPAEDRIFGYEAGELIGKHVTIQNAYPPEENQRVVSEVIAHLKEKGVWTGEWKNKKKNGASFTTFARITALNFQGKLYFVCVQEDITERKLHEEALRESESRFRTMADSAPVLIWMSDESKKGIYFNKKWLEFTGRTLEAELERGWLESVHPDDRASLEVYSSAFVEQISFSTRFRMQRYDGEYRHVLDTGVPRFTEDGRFQGYIGTCVDITEIKQAEDERSRLLDAERVARREAERLSQMKDEFLAGISHELRTPLNAVLGWAQLIRKRSALPQEISNGLEIIERNARIQSKIIEDLLDMNRIISGKVRLEVREVDPREVVKNAIETVRPAAEAKGITLELKEEECLGLLRGDAGRLQQVFWNLLANAVKFTGTGGNVWVTLATIRSSLEVAISDTGEGINSTFLPHVFDRFRQADASITRRHGGLGLGLAIVKHLIELHGGTVWVESEGEGRGSTFTVRLPLSTPSSVASESSPSQWNAFPSEATSYNFARLTDMRVLVVDDQPDALQLVKTLLEENGAAVEVASSAEEGLALLKTTSFDVLISDIGMPHIDGYEFIRRVRNLKLVQRGIPAIALTAFARTEDRLMALKAGYQLHVPKPVEPFELFASIHTLIARDEEESVN